MSAPAESSAITLSTMTLDGYITNVKFDKVTAIEHLKLTDSIVEIGCNFGHKISDSYKNMPCYKDRISKKKKRGELKTRRSQGLGTHFNSQITFTIITDHDVINSYQVKLFTNGRVQIPGIGKLSKGNDELLDDILSIMISYIQMYPDVLMFQPKTFPPKRLRFDFAKLDLEEGVQPEVISNVEPEPESEPEPNMLPSEMVEEDHGMVHIDYLTPILQNFKARTLLADDCMHEVRVVEEDNKNYQMIPFIDLSEFEKALIEMSATDRPPFPIDNMIFNPERYSGMLIKFSTPKIVSGNQKIDKLIEMVRLYYYKNATRSRIAKPSFNDSDSSITRMFKVAQAKWYENSKGSKKCQKKLTTVKLFRSGKINIDHVNNMEQATIIRAYIVRMIMNSWDSVVYYNQ